MKKIILIMICSSLLFSVSCVKSEAKEVLGWLEMVRVYPLDFKMRAKMDTGAKSSSINVYNIKKFNRDEELWVSFELKEKTKKKDERTLLVERKVLDTVKIKKKGGGLDERYVVEMEICISGLHKKIAMNIVDRSNFNYQILIGRDDLKDAFIIDPSATFTHKPACKIAVQVIP